MVYGIRNNGNLHGLVLTKPIVVKTILDRVDYIPSRNLNKITVLEPAAGNGAFAVEIIHRLHKSSLNFGFSFEESLSNLRFNELDPNLASQLYNRVEIILSSYSTNVPQNMISIGDYLTSTITDFDLIVGNPPYVRHENIPKELKSKYKSLFHTFRHRSDLYIPFFEKALNHLKPNGTLSYICSNRWLKNQYGKNLRDLVSKLYHLNEIIDLEGIDAFEESVIAYPSIVTIKNANSYLKTKVYSINSLTDLIELDGKTQPSKYINTNNTNNWFSPSFAGTKFEKYLDLIENQGFSIGIGVATGADSVFIRKDFKEIVENELLLPIITGKDLKGNQFSQPENFILNPFDEFGELIDLDNYPKAKSYLLSHRKKLSKRHIAKSNPKFWYKTIDKIKTELTHQTKLLLPDISGNNFLFIDDGKFYPHHNLYYITGRSHEDLIILASALMSDFSKAQLEAIGNKMNGGYPRWQSQNLRKLRLPNIDSIPHEIRIEIIEAYNNRDLYLINSLFTESSISLFSIHTGQTRLFEPNI